MVEPRQSNSGRPAPEGLTQEERDVYAWQMDVPGFGTEGQEKLKNSTVLISRVGGLGSVVALELAAAGIGHLVLAHGGNIKPSDLNRQLLMTHDALGTPRVESARRRLLDLNPRLEITTIPENATHERAAQWIQDVDLVVDCAPLFEERLALNAAAVANGKPMVECAMFDLEAWITSIRPGTTPCLECLVPEPPPAWKRRFPVFGAVSGTVGCLGAMEAIKLLTNLGDPLLGRMLTCDLRTMRFRTLEISKRPDCATCGSLTTSS